MSLVLIHQGLCRGSGGGEGAGTRLGKLYRLSERQIKRF